MPRLAPFAIAVALVGLALVAIHVPSTQVLAQEEEEEGPPPLAALFEPVGQLEVAVPEISGMAPLDSDDPTIRAFLVVTDEGRHEEPGRSVEGALYRVSFQVTNGEKTSVAVQEVTPVPLDLGRHVDRVDPLYARVGGWRPDLEACVRLPGTEDLFLLGGERGAEDAYDGGANRLYVVRYPTGEDGHAQLEAYLKLPDLDDDTINDRFEAVAAIATDEKDTWHAFALKERTAAMGRVPRYFPLRLRKGDEGFEISAPALAGRRPLPALLGDRERIGAQADACVTSKGVVWVLDRWRRELHLASVEEGMLRYEETLDCFAQAKTIPEETGTDEPAAPGCRHAGYGRLEALTFDAQGWLWMAADLGGGTPSVVTVLAPRAKTAPPEEGGKTPKTESEDGR